MDAIKRVIVAACFLTAAACLAAPQWRGFHGVEQEGRCDSPAGPLHWSPSQHVVWKTPVPGRGHSSPILSGDAVYVTTTYENPQVSAAQRVWHYATFGLVCLLTVAGVSLATQSTIVPQRRIDRIWQHGRFFLLAQLLMAVALVVLFGRRLLDWDDNAARFWPTSIVVALTCLGLAVLFVPLKSRQHLLAGVLSVAFVIPAFVALDRKELIFAFDSRQALLVKAMLALPVLLGGALITAYLVQRRRPAVMIQDAGSTRSHRPVLWPYLATAAMGCVAALTPFFLLLYRAADYQMPDSYILDDRVRPEVGWGWVGLYAGLVLIAVAVCLRNAGRGAATRRVPWQPAFFLVALCLGAVHFAGIGPAGRPKEFTRAVVCLDRNTGKVLWTCGGLTAQVRPQNRVVTHASATPATDGQRIYAYFGEDGLMCVSPDGKLLWKRAEPMFQCKFGVGTSPVVRDEILVVVSDVKESAELASSIMALDGRTGTPLWKRERKSHKDYATYCTPAIKLIDARQVVIVHGWHDLKGYDLKTGAELWSYPTTHDGQHLVASLVSDAQRLYVTEAKRIVSLDFATLGTGSDPVVWSRPLPGEKSATPVVVEGLLFLVTEPGLAYCLDARTGEILWKQRLKGRYFSSVVALDRHILFTSEAGQTTVVAADRQYRQVAANTLGEPIYASLAPAGDQLFMRTTIHVYCIQEKLRP